MFEIHSLPHFFRFLKHNTPNWTQEIDSLDNCTLVKPLLTHIDWILIELECIIWKQPKILWFDTERDSIWQIFHQNNQNLPPMPKWSTLCPTEGYMTPMMEIAGLIYHMNIGSGLQYTLIGLMSCASFSQPLWDDSLAFAQTTEITTTSSTGLESPSSASARL